MTYYPDDWFLIEDTEEAREHRKSLGVDKHGRPLAAPTLPAPKPKAKPKRTATSDKKIFNASQMGVLARVIADIRDEFEKKLKPLETAAAFPFRFRGIWKHGESYRLNDFVTCGGSMWACLASTESGKPGL